MANLESLHKTRKQIHADNLRGKIKQIYFIKDVFDRYSRDEMNLHCKSHVSKESIIALEAIQTDFSVHDWKSRYN